jgi:hypothetical protein
MEPMDKTMRGFTNAALTLSRKDSGDDKEGKKKKVIKDIIKDKTGKRKKGYNFDPEPELKDSDTILKT